MKKKLAIFVSALLLAVAMSASAFAAPNCVATCAKENGGVASCAKAGMVNECATGSCTMMNAEM